MSKPGWVKELAEKRIRKLFKQAEQEFEDHPERSDRYMEIAHKISKRYNVPIPKDLKKKICPECHGYWKPDQTVKVRTDPQNSRVIYRCQECEAERTYGYREQKPQKGTD